MLSVLLSFICAAVFAQSDTRPALFAAYPQTVPVTGATISHTLSYTTGETATITFSPQFSFTGKVIFNQQKYDNLKTVMLRSEVDNTTFQLSRITNPDNSVVYAGRILNENSADGYLIKNDNGVYRLQKTESQKILEPCKF